MTDTTFPLKYTSEHYEAFKMLFAITYILV